MKCINHPHREATHLKDSYFKGKPPNPICEICVKRLQKYYPQIYNNHVREMDARDILSDITGDEPLEIDY